MIKEKPNAQLAKNQIYLNNLRNIDIDISFYILYIITNM